MVKKGNSIKREKTTKKRTRKSRVTEDAKCIKHNNIDEACSLNDENTSIDWQSNMWWR